MIIFVRKEEYTKIFTELALLLLASLSLISALYSFPGPDEGFFIQIAKSMSHGSLMYSDIPGMYGPFFFKFNEIVFSLFGFTHFISRISVWILGTSTFFILVSCIRRENPKAIFSSIIYPGVWYIVSAQRFSESLHPGWYISLLLSLISSSILSETKYRFPLIGVSCAFLLGMKLHIGLVTIIAILQIILLETELQVWRICKYVPSFLLFLLLCLILKIEIYNISIVYLIPFCITAIIFLLSLKLEYKSLGGFYSNLMRFLVPLVLVTASIYVLACYHYGAYNLKHYMVDIPRQFYVDYYLDVAIASIMTKLQILILYLITFLIIAHRKMVGKLLWILPFFMVISSSLSVHFFILIHISLLMQCIYNRYDRYIPLLLLSSVQIIHLYPVPGTQVYYASAILWLLLGLISRDEFDFKLRMGISKFVIVCGLYILAILLLPVSQAILKGDKIIFLSSILKNNEHILISENEGTEIFKLINYLKPRLHSTSRLLTIPRYDSLNLLIDNFPPNNVNLFLFSDLSEKKLDEIGANLFDSDYVVLFPKSSGAANAFKSAKLLETILKYQDFVTDSQILDGKNSHETPLFKILRKKTGKE